MKNIISIKKESVLKLLIVLLFILIGTCLRLLPHPPNFTPIIVLALFGSVCFSKKIAFILPMAIMMISDIFIGYYEFSLMISIYGSILLCVSLGFWLKKHKKWQTILGSSLLAGLIFFLITNFAVWVFTPWYTKTLSGLVQCYLMAIPFFKMTLLGNLFYASTFFGIYSITKTLIKKGVAKKHIPAFLIISKY
jgi:hypothetical protein